MSILSSIGDLFSGSSGQAAAQAQTQALQQGYTNYADLASKAAGAVSGYGGQAAGAWSPVATGANAGAASYADATGVNGPEGLARARAAFGGIVQPDINMALDAMTRQAKAQGVASGNVLADESKYAANELNKRYLDYVNMLNPYLGQQTQAASGLAGTYMGTGGALGSIYTGQGQAALGTAQNVGASTAQGILAPTVGAGNLINLGVNAAQVAASLLGGKGGSLIPMNTGLSGGMGVPTGASGGGSRLY